MKESIDTIETLNDLIETCKNGEYGFRECAGYARDAQLKATFEARSEECRAAAAQLQVHVRELGGKPDLGGSMTGALHRGWVTARYTLSSDHDLALLEECERGEDAALESYREALTQEMPLPVRNLVEAQYQGVKQNHDVIRRLRDSQKAA
jgi:uncharacterized protein (TIGR02284 family)